MRLFRKMSSSKRHGVLFYLALGIMSGFLLPRLSQFVITRRSSPVLEADYGDSRSILKSVSGALEHTQHRHVEDTVTHKGYSFDLDHEHKDDDTVAADLYKKVRILCWIMTHPGNFELKVRHIKATWGKRCNIFLVMTSVENQTYSAIGLNITEGREHLTGKTMQAFKHCYDNYFDKADWFLKADDDTFVIVENLRYFLSNKNTWDPVYYGHNFEVIIKGGYFSGGAGYVIGKEALKRFAEQGYGRRKICRIDGGAEDAEFGGCMLRLGVKAGLSVDTLGRKRFHAFDPGSHIMGAFPGWYIKNDRYNGSKGMAAISDYAITFHYVRIQQMYAFDFFLYHLRPYGIQTSLQEIN